MDVEGSLSNYLERLVAELLNAARLCNVALEDGAERRLQLSAVRALHRAIRKVVENDQFWSNLARQALDADGLIVSDHLELLEMVSDVLTEQQAYLLFASGYRIPPPPSASYLVDTTQSAVADLTTAPGRGLERVEGARAALRKFLEELQSHLAAAYDKGIVRVLAHGRRVCVAAGLVVLVNHMQVKTGDHFDVSIGASVKDRMLIHKHGAVNHYDGST